MNDQKLGLKNLSGGVCLWSGGGGGIEWLVDKVAPVKINFLLLP